MKTTKLQTAFAAITNCCVANASFTGRFYYANGALYKSVNSGYYCNSIYTPVKPATDLGAPSESDGWIWRGWYWGTGIVAANSYESSGMGTSDFTRDYYSYYSRANKYYYYNTSSSLSEKDWEQSIWDGSDAKSRLDLPELYGPISSGWIPKGWSDKDRVCNSSDDICYSAVSKYACIPPLNIGRNLRAVYYRTVTMSFDGNGSTGGSVGATTISQWLVSGLGSSGSLALPENGFSKAGYSFKGWNTNPASTTGMAAGTTVTPSSAWASLNSQTNYAIWAANKYTVIYDANGGTGEMSSFSATYDEDVIVSSNNFTKTAFVFKGWAMEQEGDVVYEPGQCVRNLTSMPDGTVTLYAVWTALVVPDVVVSAADNPVFCGDSHTVTLACPLEGAKIYYTTNGVTPRTVASFEYTEPIVIYGSVELVAVAVREGVKSEYSRVTIKQISPEAPIISPVNGTEFRTETCEITIACATEGAVIYYTLDGSNPQVGNWMQYTNSFNISKTTTIKAIAVGGPYESEVTSATLTYKQLSLSEAAGSVDLTFQTDENYPWMPTVDASAATGLSAQSGEIGVCASTWMETTVNGVGTFSFKWRVDCEKDDSGKATWDRMMVYTNDVEALRIDGNTDWADVTFVFDDWGEHTLRWEFVKDDYDEELATYADCGWVSGVNWVGVDPMPNVEDCEEVTSVLLQTRDSERLLNELSTVSEYNAFRSWIDDKCLSHSLVRDAPNAWLSYKLDSAELMSKSTSLTNNEIIIKSITPAKSSDGAMELVVDVAEVQIGPAARLAEALGIEGSIDLNGTEFSSEGLTVTLERTSDGKAKATVKPSGETEQFFMRVKVLK